MYYLLSFKLLRRNSVSKSKAKLDGEFIGFSEFLNNLPDDKKISVCII
jgi:hypothetical protein